MKWAVWLLMLEAGLTTAVAGAGELILKNGDRLQGDLVKLEGESVTWASDTFGNLEVPKIKIEKLLTTTLLKMDGHSEPCTVTGVTRGEFSYSCADNTNGRLSLLTLERAVPYEDHLAGVHSYRGKLALAGTHSRGNTKEEDWELDSEVEFRRGDYRHVAVVEFESRTVGSAPATEEFALSYSLDWFFQERWFWNNDVTIGADESKNIDERYLMGSGFGFQFWENDVSALSVQYGLSVVKELFDRVDLTDDTFDSESNRIAWRWATNFRYALPFSTSLSHKHELLYSLEDSDDWEFDSATALNIPLGAGLFSEFKMEYDYNGLLLQDERRADTKFSVGVGYVW